MNLDTTIAIDLKGFFHWWGKELAFLVPKSLRQRLREHSGRLVYIPSTSGFDGYFFDDDGNLMTQQSVSLASSQSLQVLKAQYPTIEKAEIVLRLAGDQALYKLIYLPEAAQENLQQVVGFELDRYTPFKVEQVYYAAVLQGKTDQGQLKVLLVVAPKQGLDQQLAALESIGVKPHKIDYASVVSDLPQLDNTYNLLPERYQQRRSTLSQSVSWLVGSLILILALAAMVWPVWIEGQAVDSLKSRIQQLEKQKHVVDSQQMEIDALRAETQKLIDNKYQAPSLLAALNELSLLLKEDTWLTHLQFTDKRMQIQGQSPAASALIGLLESSEYFSNVSFVSPLTQDKTTGRERFQISLDVSIPVVTPPEDESAAEQTEADVTENAEGATVEKQDAKENVSDE